MDIRTKESSSVNLEAILQKIEQQRFQNISRYHSMNSPSRMGEDSLTLSHYALEFKDLKGMLEEEQGIRKDERSKSKKLNKEGKRGEKGKYKAYSEEDSEDSEEDSEVHIDDWG